MPWIHVPPHIQLSGVRFGYGFFRAIPDTQAKRILAHKKKLADEFQRSSEEIQDSKPQDDAEYIWETGAIPHPMIPLPTPSRGPQINFSRGMTDTGRGTATLPPFKGAWRTQTV